MQFHTTSCLDNKDRFAGNGEWLGCWDTLIEDLSLESVLAAPSKGQNSFQQQMQPYELQETPLLLSALLKSGCLDKVAWSCSHEYR